MTSAAAANATAAETKEKMEGLSFWRSKGYTGDNLLIRRDSLRCCILKFVFGRQKRKPRFSIMTTLELQPWKLLHISTFIVRGFCCWSIKAAQSRIRFTKGWQKMTRLFLDRIADDSPQVLKVAWRRGASRKPILVSFRCSSHVRENLPETKWHVSSRETGQPVLDNF